MSDTSPSSATFISDLTAELGLPENFLFSLLQDDDWSFLIKAHAFVEAALTHLLTVGLRHSGLEKAFARLDTSDPLTGKIAFARGAYLLEPPAIQFVVKLSELRNLVVHDVRKVGFSLPAWHTALDSNQKRAFLTAMTFFATVAPEGARLPPEAALNTARTLLTPSPKHLLWFNVCMFGLVVHNRSAQAHTLAALERQAVEAIQAIRARNSRA